jgi:hypothetical protein
VPLKVVVGVLGSTSVNILLKKKKLFSPIRHIKPYTQQMNQKEKKVSKAYKNTNSIIDK